MDWRRHSHLHPSLGTNLPGICIVHDLKLCQAGFAKLCKLLPAETVASCQEVQSMSESCSTSHLQCQISISTVGICFTQLPYAALIHGSNSSTDLVFWVSFCQATVIHLALPSPGTSQQPWNSRVCLSHPTPQTFDAKKERRSNRKLAALQKWCFRGTLCTGFFHIKIRLSMRNHTFKQKYYSSILLQTQTVSSFVGLKSLKLQNEVVTSVTGIGPESFASGPIGWHWLCHVSSQMTRWLIGALDDYSIHVHPQRFNKENHTQTRTKKNKKTLQNIQLTTCALKD